MAPKQEVSKKAKKAKQDKAIEDLTFGLKNKNKSAKVQQFIGQVNKSVKNDSANRDADQARKAKEDKKLAKQLQEEEMRLLFNEGIAGQFGKAKKATAEKAAKLGIADANPDLLQIIEDKIAAEGLDSSDSDSDSDDDVDGCSYYSDDEPTSVEVFREKTIEDIIEEQRAKLAAEGKAGTPVTAETFAAWRAAKLAKKQAEAEARAMAELSKKKGSKGLSVLTGKELFNFNSSLFVDDDCALDQAQEEDMNREMVALLEEEERRAQEEYDRAQEIQAKLREAELIEEAYRQRRIEEWRQLAADPNRPTFLFGDVTVNEVVFSFIIDDKEDLSLFPEPSAVDEVFVKEVTVGLDELQIGGGGYASL